MRAALFNKLQVREKLVLSSRKRLVFNFLRVYKWYMCTCVSVWLCMPVCTRRGQKRVSSHSQERISHWTWTQAGDQHAPGKHGTIPGSYMCVLGSWIQVFMLAQPAGPSAMFPLNRVSVYVCACTHAQEHMEVRGQLLEVLSFHRVESRDRTQVGSLGRKCSSQLSHLTGPFIFWICSW